ncbi:MAG: hypothetical protein MUQ26_08755, partial [Armatimonadetes bacterium]|nr:hypothetical protein [Armatimonadota bacterium]
MMGVARRTHVQSLAAAVCILLSGLVPGRAAAGAAQQAGVGATAEGPAAGSRVILENVDRYRVNEPLFEGVRVILSYRGEMYSPAYVQGISGAAFRIGGPCPCAPTCEYAMSTDAL